MHICPYNQDGLHFIDLVQDFDAALLLQWHRDRLQNAASFYPDSTVPVSHFVRTSIPRIPRSVVPAGSSTASPPATRQAVAARREAPPPSPDFTSAQPIFELVNPPLIASGVFQQFHHASPTGARKPVLRHPDGKSSLICFSSSVSPPFNVCNLAQCLREQTKRTRNSRYQLAGGPPPFCHIDLSKTYWASQPEAFWAPVVEWLRLPGISATIRPSSFLRAKTPSTPW